MNNKLIDNFDRRAQAVTTTKGNGFVGGNLIPDGSLVYAVGISKLKQDEMSFLLPNMTAVFLDAAQKAYENTSKFYVYKNFKKEGRYFMPKDDDSFYTILQNRLANIINAFCALESFMNESIPEDFICESEHKKNKIWKKEDVERRGSSKRKLKNIMRDVYKIDGEIKDDIKEMFEELQAIRNRIIHLKQIDKVDSDSKDTIWYLLLKSDFPNYTINVKKIISYFYNNIPDSEKPRWYLKYPY